MSDWASKKSRELLATHPVRGMHVSLEAAIEVALRAARLDGMRRAREELARVAIVFDGPPSHKSGRFVEAELDGKSANIGEWEQRGKYWELRPTRAIDRLIAEAEKGDEPTAEETER